MKNLPDTKRMLLDIQKEIEFTKHMIGKSQFEENVMTAVEAVPRHQFVPENLHAYAYDNGPLSIGHGQTISQPYIVALMTDLLDPKAEDVVLEVGTGSGYQSAVLAQIVQQVYSVEIIPELTTAAVHLFEKLGYNNIQTKVGDGYYGWTDYAPYDGIIVTAAAPYIPEPLIEQLKVGAKLVIPVGQPYSHQELMVVEKNNKGEYSTRDILSVAFVPLTGNHKDQTFN